MNRGVRRAFVAVVTATAVMATLPPGYATTPTDRRLRGTLLAESQLKSWTKDVAATPAVAFGALSPEPTTTFCNVVRQVAWQGFAGANYVHERGRRSASELLYGYRNQATTHRALHELRRASYQCKGYYNGGLAGLNFQHIARPAFGGQAFAVRTELLISDVPNHYRFLRCVDAFDRHGQVLMHTAYCSTRQAPHRDQAMQFARRAYRKLDQRL